MLITGAGSWRLKQARESAHSPVAALPSESSERSIDSVSPVSVTSPTQSPERVAEQPPAGLVRRGPDIKPEEVIGAVVVAPAVPPLSRPSGQTDLQQETRAKAFRDRSELRRKSTAGAQVHRGGT